MMAWKRVGRNIAMILGGRAVFGLLNLAAASLAVHAIGITAFGVIVMLQGYVRLIAGILKFPSWMAVTKFGADALAKERPDDLRRLTGFTIRLDFIALVLSIGLALLVAPYAGEWLEWPPEAMPLVPLFIMTIPFMTSATPTGILRLFDMFGVLVRQHALNAIIRFVGALIVFFIGGGLEEVIITWTLAYVLSGGYMVGIAWLEVRKRDLKPRIRGSWASLTEGFPRIWRFVLVLNATSMLNTLPSQASALIVGAMLGPAAAGVFGIVRQLSEAMKTISNTLGQIIFPEFAWMEAAGNRRVIAKLLWRTMAYASVILGVFCVFLIFAGEFVLSILFTKATAVGAPLLAVTGVAGALGAVGFSMQPVLLTIRKEKAVFLSMMIATVLYFPMIWAFTGYFGLIGAGLALLIRQVMIFTHRMFVLYRALVLKPAGKLAK